MPGFILGLALLLGAGSSLPYPCPAQPAFDGGVEGTWLGTLKGPGYELRLVFHISKEDDGTFTATLDSPDQGATGVPVSEVIVSDDSLRLEVQVAAAVYEGRISEDGTTIDGTWTQGGGSLPLVLTRTDDAPELRRPQEPKEPYPYEAEDVVFDHAEAGIQLAGTLTLPRAEGPFPAVILISGSGPQDRDEALLGHRPFLVLADYLTRRGIAVLRFDDRGIGQSQGSFATATSEDFAGDVLAGVTYLKSRPEINPAQIGLAGHSEGGLIAPMVAVRSSDVAFIVLMAGPGLTGEEILYRQAALINRVGGTSEEAIAANRTLQERMFAVLKEEPDSQAAAGKLRAIMEETLAAMSEQEREELGFAGDDVGPLVLRQIMQVNSPWFRYFLTYNPRPTLEQVTCPVLAVNGEKDLQVPPKENLRAIEEALQAGGHADYKIVEFPDLNHLFQTAETGSLAEYGRIEETFAPAALEVIGTWILEKTSAQ